MKSKYFNLCLLILFLAYSYKTSAQLSGTYSIGPGGSYTNLTAVATALNSTCLSSDVLFEFLPGYTSVGEVYPITFNQPTYCFGGPFNVVIRPGAGVAAVNTINTGYTRTIDFNGADYFQLDGRPGGITVPGVWTIQGGNGSNIMFVNDATYNKLSYLKVESRTTYNIHFSTTTGTTGNDFNVIEGNDIRSFGSYTQAVGINSDGTGTTTSTRNSDNSIVGNRIYNFGGMGIDINSGTGGNGNNWIISGNSIYQTITIAGNISGISFRPGSNSAGNTITNNYFGGSGPECTGSPTIYSSAGINAAINISVAGTTPTIVSGNIIDNITVGASFTGINVASGSVTISNNYIGTDAIPGNITVNGSASIIYGISSFTNNQVLISNCQVANITSTSTGAQAFIGISGTGSSGSTQISNCVVKNISSPTTYSNGNPETFYLPAACSMMGIYTNAPGAGISGNTISGLHATTTSAVVVTVCGIALQGSGMDCSKNKIYDLTNSATAGSPFPYIIGIYNYFNPLGRTISNNMISLSNGALTNGVKIYGILDREGSVAVNYYFNSVAISGTTAAAVNSAAYRRTGNGSSSTKLKGNIFYNNRGGSGDHFALINSNGSATEWPAATSDYNNLYTSNPSTLGAWPDATNRDISSWKTISGGDVNSKNVKTSFFDIYSDLHLNLYTNGNLSNAAIPFGGVSTDFDSETGSRSTTPDIGADEFIYLPPSCNTSFTEPLCYGESNGTASIVIANGGAPFEYLWSTSQITNGIIGIPAGIYTVTVTDTTSFQICNSSVNVSQPPLLVASSSAPPILCNGGNTNITVSATGGTMPYTGTGIFSVTAGNYSYTVTDDNGCTSATGILLTEPSLLVISENHIDATCDNLSDGSVDLTVSGGTPPYTYLWSNAAITQDISGLSYGSYTVTVSDDNNCTGLISVVINYLASATLWYADADGDGYGNLSSSVLACNQPSGYVANSADCNDANFNVNPAATEVCNGIDDDCDGLIDDADPSVVGQSTWYADADGDGYGNLSSSVLACNQPSGYVANSADCNDANFNVNPAATEICNGIDDDCDGLIDEGCSGGCTMTVNAGSDENTYYGYSGDQTVTHTAVITGGTAPYIYTWTLNRPLLCNQITSNGDEIFSSSGGSCSNAVCPTTGSPINPATCSGSPSITSKLMDTATVCVTVIDAFGCIATDCFVINAEDARCFSGINQKVLVCHATGNPNKPWVQLCVEENAALAHVNHGCYLGSCYNQRVSNSTPSKQYSIFPNPASSVINIHYISEESSTIILELRDLSGRLVKSQMKNAVEGENDYSIDTDRVMPGNYILTIISNSGVSRNNVSIE